MKALREASGMQARGSIAPQFSYPTATTLVVATFFGDHGRFTDAVWGWHHPVM